MKDHQLYSLVKKAVRQRSKIPPHTETKSFAQRYCERQLQKKYKPFHSPHKRIGMIMKKFTELETYFNLPQLIRDIKQMKKKQQEQNVPPKILIKQTQEEQIGEQSEQEIPPLKKHYTSLSNLRYALDSDNVKQFIDTLETDNQWRSEILKNNSAYHMENVHKGIKEEQGLSASPQSIRLFKLLGSFLKNTQENTINQKKSQYVRGSKKIAENKKQGTKFLHKVSSYLHIILQNEHKNKWGKRRHSSVFKPPAELPAKDKPKIMHKRFNTKDKGAIKKDLSDMKYIEAIKEQTKMIKGQQPLKQTKYFTRAQLTESHSTHTANPTQKLKQSSHWTRPTKQSFFSTAPSFPNPNTTHMKQTRHHNSMIKQTFTFRRRSVKEKIMKKIDQFICEVDEETHCNRKENHYYNNEINKLENNMKRLYGRYRKQTIAGEEDIQNLKKLAQEYSMLTPSRRNSRRNDEDSSKPTTQQNVQ